MIWIALAGGAGASARFVFDGIVRSQLGDRLPWGTLIINLLGSFLLGWLVGASTGRVLLAILGTGFLGGFTTFSAASFETARLTADRRWTAALLYGVGTLVFAVAAAAAGYAIGS